MNAIIIGGGKVGVRLASLLLTEKHSVKVIEVEAAKVPHLQKELGMDVVIQGDGTEPTVLEAAGIRQANVVAAVCGHDEVNLVIASLARVEYNIPRTIARVNNPKNAWMFTPQMGVDVAVNQADLMAYLILEEMSLGDMMTLLKLRRGRYSLVEEKVPKGAKAIGVQIKDLGLPDQCVIAAIIRKGQVTLPRGTATLEEYDEVLAITDEEGAKQLAFLLEPPDRSTL